VFPFVIIVVSELRDVAPPGLVEGGFGGGQGEILQMIFSFSAVYAAVATVTRFRFLEPLSEVVKEIVGKIVRF